MTLSEFITRTYLGYLGRPPEPDAVDDWTPVIKDLRSPATFVNAVLDSPEFRQREPALIAEITGEHVPIHPVPTPYPATTGHWFSPVQTPPSEDYFNLFLKPDLWKQARSKIAVFGFYDGTLLSQDEYWLNRLIRIDAFDRLADMGLAIALEVGAIKPQDCRGDGSSLDVLKRCVDVISRHGGTVQYLVMDEPYIGGQIEVQGKSCRFTPERCAEGTARFIAAAKTAFPHLVIGDSEPYPHFSIRDLMAWVGLLETCGVTLPYFHFDVDMNHVLQLETNPAYSFKTDVMALRDFFAQKSIQLAPILTANHWQAKTDQEYYQDTLAFAHRIKDTIGAPSRVVCESWYGSALDGAVSGPGLPVQHVPETDPWSMMRGINDCLTVLYV